MRIDFITVSDTADPYPPNNPPGLEIKFFKKVYK